MTTESRQKRKKGKTHQLIMHSAKQLFEAQGISGVTIEDIAKKADISRSTFFTHFSSVEELLSAIAGQEIIDLMEACGDVNGVEFVRSLLHKLLEDTCPYPMLTVELLFRGILQARAGSPFRSVVDRISEELVSVERNTSVAEEKSSMLLGLYFGLVYNKIIRKENFEDLAGLKAAIDKYIIKILD